MATKQDYQKRNKALSAIVAVLLAIVMCASVVLGVGFGVYGKNTDDWFKKQDADQGQEQSEQPEQPSDDSGENIENTARVSILSGATIASEDGTVSKTLTAVVLPEDAPNKAVDWSIAWADGDSRASENISDYITVTPASDGALTATVTCKKSFRGSVAYVKVVTREGKFEATSMITFDGIPSSLSVNKTGLSTGSGADAFQYMIPTNGASLAIDLTNVFGDVGESYYNNLSFTTSASGKITIQNYQQSRVGASWTGSESQITLESIKDSIFSVKIENNKLVITPKKTVESYYQSITGGSAYTQYTGKFKSYVANSAGSAGVTPYFTIVVKCGDLSTDFNFRIISSVSSVSVTPSITF